MAIPQVQIAVIIFDKIATVINMAAIIKANNTHPKILRVGLAGGIEITSCRREATRRFLLLIFVMYDFLSLEY